MKTLKYNAIAAIVAAMMVVPVTLSSALADDDWEDRHEDYEEAIEEQREEAEERWEEEQEALEELREDGVIVRRHGWHGYYPPDAGYRVYRHPGVRYYRYYDGPVHRTYYWGSPRVYRYGGTVHAGPAHVYYGRHGGVHVGPVHVYW